MVRQGTDQRGPAKSAIIAGVHGKDDGKLTVTAGESAAWQLVLAPTSDPDTFTIASGADLTGERARFQRLPGGRVRSVLLMDTTWERLEPAG
jgi:hypothetical protein